MNCPVCASGRIRKSIRGFLRCRGCGFLFSDGASTDKTLACAPPSEASPAVWFDSKRELFASGLKMLEEPAGRKGRLLDIGCGFGYFMSVAAAAGWQCEGVEISAPAVARCRAAGLKVSDSPLRENDFGENTFDAVTMWGVLDVLPSPSEELAAAQKILKPGGSLFIRVNNVSFHLPASRLAAARPFRALGLKPGIIHRYGFGAKSLLKILESSGFTDVRIYCSRPSAGDPYVTGGALGPAFVSLVKKAIYILAETIRAATVGRVFLSSAVTAVARKKDARRKALHIITRLDTGGSAKSAQDMCRLLSDKYRVTLASGGAAVPSDSEFYFRRLSHLKREISPFSDALAFVEIFRLITVARPDIVHTHSSKAGVLGRWAAFFARLIFRRDLKKMKIVHTPHGHIFYGYYGKMKNALFLAAERLSAKITDKFVALTEGEKNESVAFGVGRPEDWVIIHSGVEDCLAPTQDDARRSREAARAELGIVPDCVVVGTVARLEAVKGVEYFVRAAAMLARRHGDTSPPRDLKFIAVGDGSLASNLKKLAERLGLAGRIIFTGERDDAQRLINAMDIYVQPSLNEGMGRTIVEAMYLSKPIVATRVQGIPDLIEDRRTGILVAPSSAEELASAISEFLADPSFASRAGAAARRAAASDVGGLPRFGAASAAILHEKLYEKIFE